MKIKGMKESGCARPHVGKEREGDDFCAVHAGVVK